MATTQQRHADEAANPLQAPARRDDPGIGDQRDAVFRRRVIVVGLAAPNQVASSGHTTVSVGISIGATEYTTYFPENLIKLTDVAVGQGTIAYMGTFALNQSVGLDGADPSQRYFYRMFAPAGHEDMNYLSLAFSGDYHYRGSLRNALQSDGEQAKFREHAREALGEVGWGNMVR